MNNLEASLEILKIVVAQEDFKNSSLDETTNKITELFQIIYKKLSETTGEANLNEVASSLIAINASGGEKSNTDSGGGAIDSGGGEGDHNTGGKGGGGDGDHNTGGKGR